MASRPGVEIRVWGSTELIRTLAEHDLIDEYPLAVYALMLGVDKKLFSYGFALARLSLVETHALRSGVLINTYRSSNRAERDRPARRYCFSSRSSRARTFGRSHAAPRRRCKYLRLHAPATTRVSISADARWPGYLSWAC